MIHAPLKLKMATSVLQDDEAAAMGGDGGTRSTVILAIWTAACWGAGPSFLVRRYPARQRATLGGQKWNNALARQARISVLSYTDPVF